ncbi:MAG: VanZ family protein [Bacteroidetes bacterium]|nr:VanZ family protein [Bacteroidota bacterium]MBU1717753.1 VanZ family protein [Bacteroidota bacterium]
MLCNSKYFRNNIGILAVLYLAVILAIMFFADIGWANRLWGFMRGVPLYDKFGHFFLVGILALLVDAGLKFRTFRFSGLNYRLGSICVFVFVLLEECSQFFFSTRDCSSGDLLADIAGIFVFAFLLPSLFSTPKQEKQS